jgi:hypothetical protein
MDPSARLPALDIYPVSHCDLHPGFPPDMAPIPQRFWLWRHPHRCSIRDNRRGVQLGDAVRRARRLREEGTGTP